MHPGFVRQGIGRRLLTEIESVAIEKGYKTLNVMSSLSAVKGCIPVL
ncbi:MAG: GNAT family N-acetyltransferase [Hormoscilla sp. SP5CHS1]|nr:GNAT family N-acetyltransferase [Hormoscilla sp. SP5CHS1]